MFSSMLMKILNFQFDFLDFVFCILYEQTTQLTPPGSNDFPTNKTDGD